MQNKKGEKHIFPIFKKGQELSTNAMILIILGVIILVILIIGFTMGWTIFSGWIPSNNVKTIVNVCEVACSTNGIYDFCSVQRKLNDGKSEIETNCATFSVFSEYSKYGIKKCDSIDCDFECSEIRVKGNSASEKVECDELEEDITSIAKVQTGNKCCIAK